MNKIKLGLFPRKEIIDGVTIVHTGMKLPTFGFNGEIVSNEILEMYDAEGNRFYSNYDSIEEANLEIRRLAREGITAVIGPKAPWTGKNGQPIPNIHENAVGVYVVKVPEKDKVFSLKKIR